MAIKVPDWSGLPILNFPAAATLFQEKIWESPIPLRPDRKVRIKGLGGELKTPGGEIPEWKYHPQLHLRVLISVGKEYHNGAKFEALTDYLNSIALERKGRHLPDDSFHVTYVIGDSLQSWNLARDNPKLSDEQARHEASRRGTEWIEKEFKPVVMNHASYRWHAMRWTDLKKHFGPADYKDRIARVKELLKESPKFAAAMEKDIKFFVERNVQEGDAAARKRFEDYSKTYVTEEIAAFSFIPQHVTWDRQVGYFCNYMDAGDLKKKTRLIQGVNEVLGLNITPGGFRAAREAVQSAITHKCVNTQGNKMEAILQQACERAAQNQSKAEVDFIMRLAQDNTFDAQVTALCAHLDAEPQKKQALSKKINVRLHTQLTPGNYTVNKEVVINALNTDYAKAANNQVEAMLTDACQVKPDYNPIRDCKAYTPECIDLYPRGGLESFTILENGAVKGSERTSCIVEAFQGRKMGEIVDSANKTLTPPEAEIVKGREKAQQFYQKHQRQLQRILKLYDRMGTASIAHSLKDKMAKLEVTLQTLTKASIPQAGNRYEIADTQDGIKTATNMIKRLQRIEERLSIVADLNDLFKGLSSLRTGNILSENMRQAVNSNTSLRDLANDAKELDEYLRATNNPKAQNFTAIANDIITFEKDFQAAYPGNTLEEFLTHFQAEFLDFNTQGTATVYAENARLTPTHRMRLIQKARQTGEEGQSPK